METYRERCLGESLKLPCRADSALGYPIMVAWDATLLWRNTWGLFQSYWAERDDAIPKHTDIRIRREVKSIEVV